jgi:hypothetical protein
MDAAHGRGRWGFAPVETEVPLSLEGSEASPAAWWNGTFDGLTERYGSLHLSIAGELFGLYAPLREAFDLEGPERWAPDPRSPKEMAALRDRPEPGRFEPTVSRPGCPTSRSIAAPARLPSPRQARPVKVAAYQAPLLPPGSTEPSVAVPLIREQVRRGEVEGVEILCCPEAMLGGLADDGTPPERCCCVACPESPSVARRMAWSAGAA